MFSLSEDNFKRELSHQRTRRLIRGLFCVVQNVKQMVKTKDMASSFNGSNNINNPTCFDKVNGC